MKANNGRHCYISGPISNIENFNREAFKAAADQYRSLGYDVYDPIEQDQAKGVNSKDCVVGGKSRALVLKKDCEYICDFLPLLVMLPGWRQSTGAFMEHSLGKALGLRIKYKRNGKK